MDEINEITEVETTSDDEVKIKPFKPPISSKAATWILIILLIIGACSWGYSYATNVDVYAGTATSYTQWLTLQPIAGGGCIGADAPYGSTAAIERAIGYKYIVKLPVKLSEGEVVIDCDSPYPLADALEAVNGRTGIILEMNTSGDGAELAQKIYEKIDAYKGNLAVQSADLEALSWFKDNADNVIRGLSTGKLENSDMSDFEKLLHRNMLLNFKAVPYYIACDDEYLPNAIITDVNNDAYVIAQDVDSTDAAKNATQYSDNICIEGFSLY